jgi:hypothetical protein
VLEPREVGRRGRGSRVERERGVSQLRFRIRIR